MYTPGMITILQHNVRNWATNKYELYNTYRTIDPDVILINEHSLKNNARIKLFNYDTYQTNKANEQHDGVAIAIKRNFKHRLIDSFTDEFLAIKVDTTIGEIIIATVYLPPRRPYLPANDLLKLANFNRPTYILGDFNARHRIFGHNNNNNVGKSIYTIMNTGKIIHLGPNFKTFLGHTSITTPDRVFSNSKAALNYHLKQGPITTSDHVPIIMTISTSPIQIPINERFQIHKANWEGFKKDIEKLHNPNLNNKIIDEIDTELDTFHKTVTTAMKNNIPKIKYKTLPHLTLTEDIRNIQTQFNHLYNHINTNGPDRNLIQRIKQLQWQLQTLYRNKKNEQWNNIIKKINENTDSKTFWKQINQIEGKEKIKVPYVKGTNGNKIYSEIEQEKAFRKIWSEVFQITEAENENFDFEHENFVEDWLSERLDETTPTERANKNTIPPSEKITERELLHNLRKFKEKTPGLTGITKNVLINLPQKGIDFLLEIFNASLSAGYFPDDLKKTKMIFIPKEGKDNKEIINYRPISLLEVTGKLFEKILNGRLLKYLENNNVLNSRQHGFRSKRGTHTALALITETLAIAKAKKQHTNIVLRDIKKAFDKVWHAGLKHKIVRTDLPIYMKRTLCDYLTDRQIQIQIGKQLGPPFEIQSGVPQGGCLSPTLFILYTSDMPNPAPYSDYVVFADDVTQIISYPGKSKELLARHTSKAIEEINKYERKWKIQTNINKFKIIPIGRHNSAPVIVEGDIYPYETEGSVLGLTLTKTGYKRFIKNKINRLNDRLTKLRKFNNLSIENKKKLYMALIRPIIEYPPIPINAMKKTTLNDLQIIQNKSLRFIYDINYPDIVTNRELHERAGIQTIQDLINERAKEIWEKVQNLELNQDMCNIDQEVEEEMQQNNWFPLSYKALR